MKSSTIYLFRHGEIESKYQNKYIGHLNVSLSVNGIKQNKNIDNFIKKFKDYIIITSDLKRTYIGISQKFFKFRALREISFGQWEGLSWNRITKNYRKESKLFLEDPENFTFPDGESYHILKERVIKKFSEILENRHDNIVFVVHAGVIRSIISHLFDTPLRTVFNFNFDYGKCTIIKRLGETFYLESLNNSINPL